LEENMSPVETPQKAHWSVMISVLLMFVVSISAIGIMSVAMFQDAYGYPKIFDPDWGLVVVGVFVLTIESITSSQKELTEGTDKHNPTVTLGLIALGLFIVVPDTALKTYFGALTSLAIIMSLVVWLGRKNNAKRGRLS
jgi:hypothetical protein